MPIEPSVKDLAPPSWESGEEVQDLRAAAAKFTHERLEPLLQQSPIPAVWTETVRLAGTLELGRMILPEDQGGMAISRHDLAIVTEQFAAGPIERAAELTLSSAALMTLRECNALDQLPGRDVNEYFDGTTSIAPGIPDVNGTGFWLLRQHRTSPVVTIRGGDTRADLVIAIRDAGSRASVPAVRLGALSLERCSPFDDAADVVVVRPGDDRPSGEAVRRWLADIALHLGALLSGALQQGVDFALSWSAGRQTFRKPLASHQLVAARIADLIVAVHSAHVFLRCAAMHDVTGAHGQSEVICQMARHIAVEAMDASCDLVQLCGGHGYVEGLPPAARFQTVHWFAMLLMNAEAALRAFTRDAQADSPA